MSAIWRFWFFFKYFDFLADSITAVLAAAGIQITPARFSVLLPVGISFYTFQALSYTMDVYRGDVEVEHNFFRYALFVSFFPQLVAGPIERSSHLLKQVRRECRFDFERVRRGLMLMLWGFFLKMVIADRAAIFVDSVYNHYQAYTGVPLIVATMLFAVQIYCDFSGYSAIAIGAAQVLGFELSQNFRQPYLAVSVTDFWRRWHISLSSWFRDYLYIPLGGNRKGIVRKYVNLMITFLISGLWHGANWSYVLWGGLNGVMQVIGDVKERLLGRFFPDCRKKQLFSDRLLRRVITFGLICLTWVFFRAPSIEVGLDIMSRMFRHFNPWMLTDGALYNLGVDAPHFWMLMAAIAVLAAVDIAHEHGVQLRERLISQRLWFRWAVYLTGVFAVLLLGVYGPQVAQAAFIYFQF